MSVLRQKLHWSKGLSQSGKLAVFFGSNWFFLTMLLLFACEAIWLAISSRFPMAFDEGYHFGLVQFFSHHLNPLVTTQPANTYGLGAIAHNPSFLYHYLLSFPYRLVAHFTQSIQIQVIILRFINIALIVASLLVTRKILQIIRVPRVLTNIVLLAFAFTPIVTVLAAQINYDNLLILVSSVSVYQTMLLVQGLRRGQLNVALLFRVICLCLYSSLVKFSFLPFLVGITAVVVWQLAVYWRQHRATFATDVTAGFRAIPRRTTASFAVAGVIGIGLFLNFYGYDLVKYHNPVPQCNQVLTIQDCKQYYSWDRNYTVAQYEKQHAQPLQMNALQYTAFWFRVEYYQLFAEIVPTGGLIYIAHDFYIIIITLSVAAVLCTLVSARKILKHNSALLEISVIVVMYLLFLWARNYHDYRQLGQPLAIQGRYLVPVLVYVYGLLGLGIKYSLETKRSLQLVLQPATALLVVFSFVYFGGYVRYISSISPNTGWPAQTTHTALSISHDTSVSYQHDQRVVSRKT